MLVPCQWRGIAWKSLDEKQKLHVYRCARKKLSKEIKEGGFTPNPSSVKIERFSRVGELYRFGISIKSKEMKEWKIQSPSTNAKHGTHTSRRQRVLRSWSISGK